MAFQLSPGVQVTEKDLTSVVPAVGTSLGGTVIQAGWGPGNEIVTVDTENELVAAFGKPQSSNNRKWFAAASFLAYTNNLKVVRALAAGDYNATSDGGGATQIANETVYENGVTADGTWTAKYPGAIGNSIKVSAADQSDFSAWTYRTEFDYTPGDTKFVSDAGGSQDEMHIIVIDEDGVITGTAGTILEKFAGVSKAADAKDSVGRSNYYANVINNRSKYIWFGAHPTGHTDWGSNASGQTFTLNSALTTPADVTVSLSGGADANPTDGNFQSGYDLFANDELVDVNLIFVGDASVTNGLYVINSIAEIRKDCMVFVSPQVGSVLDNAGAEASSIVTEMGTYTTRSSYAVFDSGWKYMYNRYADSYVYVPCNGDVAGLCAKTDDVADPWFSPAGYNRGSIKNAVKLAWSPKKSERETLYKAGINPVVGFPGSGIVLFGDKTMLEKPSAFDRINVRRLFITLEKAIATAAKFQLFEFNDAFTRAQFRNLVEPFLRDVQGRRGIYNFKVVCDESNNTGNVIDSNQFVADIFIQPAKSINFIQLNFIATRTGISFDEVGG
jgi:hypothetical protein